MDKAKINDVVNTYSKTIGLSNYVTNVLNELMFNIISKYEKIIPNIPVESDKSETYFLKPINGTYSVEDFFLNRLMRNIWSVDELTKFSNGEVDSHTKGYYDPEVQSIYLNKNKIIHQLDKYKDVLGNNFYLDRDISIKKTIMHEFEHGLQTKFDNNLNMNNRIFYEKLNKELSKINLPNLNSYDKTNKNKYSNSRYEFTGVHYSGNKINNYKNTYRNVDGFDNLNEILNESESLEMSKRKNHLSLKVNDKNNDNSCMLRIDNLESSNYSITNYGKLFKELLGKKNSFEMMYLNPEAGFEKFNLMYNDIFRTMYNSDKDAIEIFVTAITKIKRTNSKEDHGLLCETLAHCLNKKIEHFYNNKNVSNEQINTKLNNMKDLMIFSNNTDLNNKLKHIIVFKNIEDKIRNRAKDMNNYGDNNNLEQNTRINTFNEQYKVLLNKVQFLNNSKSNSIKDYCDIKVEFMKKKTELYALNNDGLITSSILLQFINKIDYVIEQIDNKINYDIKKQNSINEENNRLLIIFNSKLEASLKQYHSIDSNSWNKDNVVDLKNQFENRKYELNVIIDKFKQTGINYQQLDNVRKKIDDTINILNEKDKYFNTQFKF